MKREHCEHKCNECPIIQHKNSELLTVLLNKLHNRLGNEVWQIVQSMCPNLTGCYECRIDDFCHVEGCQLAQQGRKH